MESKRTHNTIVVIHWILRAICILNILGWPIGMVGLWGHYFNPHIRSVEDEMQFLFPLVLGVVVGVGIAKLITWTQRQLFLHLTNAN